jgi:hypothetical protein
MALSKDLMTILSYQNTVSLTFRDNNFDIKVMLILTAKAAVRKINNKANYY